MSGRDLVNEMREGGKVPRAPASRGGLMDLLLAFVAIVAIGGLGYFGMTLWLSRQAPSPLLPAPAPQASAPMNAAWTDADTAICKSRALAAANAPLPEETMLANRAVTEGFAGLSTRLECYLSTKRARLCDPSEKAAVVAMVNDYLGRIDLVYLGLGLQGAPMKVLGDMLGGEVEGGSAMYDMEQDDTIAFMGNYQKRVAGALQMLARDGIMVPGDFAGFLGGSVPKAIEKMFGGAQPKRHLCS